ncbi:kinase-like domain-containing protein [Suillus subalutaceus]|uniref:kinase-like domain-containing protein n=1 Tax=Suillus subalutaceus TaxID=48586 RepID=UPI001B88675B|nr:kinase-like domain-containing protein [Suillus subalutaceus]KAG1873684.1 kinase-like domain-containing protein [Suillus subalutaceus]
MALKHLLARIFKRFKKSGSASALDVATAATPAPAPHVSSLCVAPLTERSPATQAIFPVNVNLRFHVVLSPTADGAHMSIQQSQVLPTLGTSCEGSAHTAQGPAPFLETSTLNSPVVFNIETTATQPTERVDTIPDFVLPSVRGLNLFGLGTTCLQDEQHPSNMAALTRPASLTDTARDSDIQCIAPVEVQPRTALVTPHSPLSEFAVATPGVARTMQTIESKDIETPQKCAGARPLIQIAGPSVGPTAEAVVPSMAPTIPDEPSSQKARLGLQRYDFVFPHFPLSQLLSPAAHASSHKSRLDPQLYDSLIPQRERDRSPPPAPHEPPRCPPGLKLPADRKPGVQAGHLRSARSVHPTQQGPPFELRQDIPKRILDNDASPRPPRGNTALNHAGMLPALESSVSNFQLYNCPPTPEVTQASTIVERISNNGNLAYSIQAGGHKYVATAQVGSGGFGYVWYAIKDQKEEVAIKVIDKAGLLAQFVYCAKDKRPTMQQLLEGSQAAAAAISSEYEAFKRVTEERSPFLTPLLHAFEDEDNFYFVMRFYPQTLRTRAKFGFMHWQLRLVAAELLLALQHLHKLRVVHLDLKMENVLVTPSGHVCIADFGNAEVLDRKLTYQQFHNERMYGASGTDGYLPPERVKGDQGYNFKTDTWTYGSILLELLLINGGHWYSIYHFSDGTHKFGNDHKIPAGYNGERRLAFIRPNDEIDLIQDKDAKDLLYSIFFPQHHAMRPDSESIRSHPFFACVDWMKLENRGYDPMFKACLGNAPLQSVDSGKIAIECSHPRLPEFKKAVLEQGNNNFAFGRMYVDYKCPTELAHDAMHGATCRAPGTKVPRRHVCQCDLPADWNKG